MKVRYLVEGNVGAILFVSGVECRITCVLEMILLEWFETDRKTSRTVLRKDVNWYQEYSYTFFLPEEIIRSHKK